MTGAKPYQVGKGVPKQTKDTVKTFMEKYLGNLINKDVEITQEEFNALSEEDKEAYEKTFEDEHGELPEAISSSALNTWIFNEDTIKEVLNVLMTNGIKIDYGQKIGKTIIFAKNHRHAEKVRDVFNKEYPHLPGFSGKSAVK